MMNKFTLNRMLLVKKYQISPLLEVVTFFFVFSGFCLFGKLLFGISAIWEIEFEILASGFSNLGF